MRNFNGISRKNVAYDIIKRHKKTGFHPLSKKPIFVKTTSGVEPPAFLGLNR